MTLPASGAISLNQVNTELGLSATATIRLGDAAVRSLADVPSGAIGMSNLHGKAKRVYATWNPLDMGPNMALSNGNLTATNIFRWNEFARATVSKSLSIGGQKWYWEITVAVTRQDLGVANSVETVLSFPGSSGNSVGYNSGGYIIFSGAIQATVASYTTGDVIGFVLDMYAATLKFYKNNVLQYTHGGLNGTYYPAGGGHGGSLSSMTANFGATAFTYSPPAGCNAGLWA